ncbi:MAG: serine/threonine protein kinase, partial [Salinibacterium sp.]|nr:serine/threonine protein kinase [Salinibacterium sp.]
MRQQESSVATKASAFDITVVDEATRRTADERLGDGTLIVDHESSSQYLPYHIESDDLRNFDSEADESRCGFIPGYSILGAIGRGGMGIVYQAIQEKLQRVVALKVLTPSKAVHPDYIQRFRSEAMAVARLNHPNVVAAYDYGEAEGRFYLAIEYVEGLDGAEMLAKKGRLDELSAVCIARDTVLGLSHALSQGIIHRDIKPA